MREGIGADHRLIGLDRESGDPGYQARAIHDLSGVKPGPTVEEVLTGSDRHHDLFEGGIASALTQTIDGALDLTGAVPHGRQRVGDRQTEVVMTVNREDRLVGVRDPRRARS
jgi:hypothetical protein